MNIVNEDVRGILQIGAGKGEEFFSYANLVNNIICFEPVEEEFKYLYANVSRSPYRTYTLLSSYVVGNVTGEVDFFIGNQNCNSSLLDINMDINSKNAHSTQTKLKGITLDDFFAQSDLNIKNYNMIYMDVQGAEHIVLEGAKDILQHIDYIFMEVSYKPLYNGTKTFEDMISYLDSLGYEMVLHNPFFGDINNDCFQGDILARRKNHLFWSVKES
jgi:FkbM family methyltransferase